MKYLRLIWRVGHRLVWETATDNTTGLAAQMAYLLLFALAPGTLFFWHLLGLFGTDPTKLHRMFVLLQSFMPPDPKVQDILDSEACRNRGLYDRAYVDKLLAEPEQHFTRIQGSKLWHLSLLEYWLQLNLP